MKRIIVILVLGACTGPVPVPVKPAQGKGELAALAGEAEALAIGFADGEGPAALASDLALPAAGYRGTPVTLTSSRPEIIATNGRVHRPECADRTVVLTARLQRGTLRRFRTFRVTVTRPVAVMAGAWSRTITVDGRIGDEEWRFAETGIPSSSPERTQAFVGWDGDWLYIGYRGPDIERTTPAAREKWLLGYFGIPCREQTGSSNAQAFRSQSFTLPFRAHFTLKWRPQDFFYNSAAFEDNAWKYTTSRGLAHYNPLGVGPQQAAREGDSLELKISRRALGNPERLHVLLFMISERPGGEEAWGIVPAAAGEDRTARGPVRHVFRTSLLVDFAAARPPRVQLEAGMRDQDGKNQPPNERNQ